MVYNLKIRRFVPCDTCTIVSFQINESQSCEYPAAVVPILSQHYMMLQRNLLYTAITRAKKLAVLKGCRKAIAIAISNNSAQRHYSALVSKIA
jgi:exodeoxyribonuclease V alpha subunit